MAAILTVDGCRADRSVLVHTLQAAGYYVVSAIDGVEALAEARSYPFDLVLVSVGTSGTGERSLIRELSRLQATSAIPIVILSEAGDDPTLPISARAHIEKPLEPHRLLATVEHVLGTGAAELREA